MTTTTYCPVCSTANRAGSLFCNQCGQPLADAALPICRSCGSAVLPGGRFCQRCGAVLDDLATPPAVIADASDEDEGPAEAEAPTLTLPETDLVLAEHQLETGRVPRETSFPAGADDLLAQLEAALPHQPLSQPVGGSSVEAAVSAAEARASGDDSAARTLASVLAIDSSATPAEGVQKPQRRGPGMLATRLMYVTLLAAVLLPFLVPGEWSGSTIPLSSSTAAFYERVYRVPTGAPVLVAFEYDPATQAELDPQARAVVAHLMQRGARIVAISLLPQGPALAESLLSELAAGQGYRYGEDYINLGYVAGEEAALASVAANLLVALPQDWREKRPSAGRAALAGVTGIRSFGAVIVFAGDEGNAMRWLTQVAGRYGIRLLAGVSAAAMTRLQPFLQSEQFAGMLVGLPGAAEYELLLNQPGRGVQMLDAQSLAHGVVVVFVLLGNLWQLVGGLRRRRAGAQA